MWHILLLFASAQAYFNESCNALHLAEICEDECNTDLNICIASAGGNYDLIHNCLRDHENCFQNCPCHAVCPHGCPCNDKWFCENDCKDLYEDQAIQCTRLCNSDACKCFDNCDIFDYVCSENCGLALVKCHQSCPCGTLCPWGCPCPGFCNEAANQTALIFTHKSYNGELESDPFLLKWIGVEHIDDDNWLHTEPVINEIPNFKTYPNTEFHSECFAVYKGQQFVLGGEKNEVFTVGDCGLTERTGQNLPAIKDASGTDKPGQIWRGHSCAVVNFDTAVDLIVLCSPREQGNLCYLGDWDPDTEQFIQWTRLDKYSQEGHADGAMVSWRNRAVLIGGQEINSQDENPNALSEYFVPSLSEFDKWSKLPDLPFRVMYHSAVAYDRWIYVFGGLRAAINGEINDLAVMRHEEGLEGQGTAWKVEGFLRTARVHHTTIWQDDRHLLIAGGREYHDEVNSDLPFEQWINIGEKLGTNGQYLMPEFIEESSDQTRKGLDNPVVFMMLNTYDATCGELLV
ncbi:unnamed protein product [Oikopleura dioica]|uniref:Uncharacterized protein n=1 Tax=Oikopleura dioica TaxID=34765 RepID=E4YIJ0_OIKDI|nr:unnamed protein product [Oikopleura dioica]